MNDTTAQARAEFRRLVSATDAARRLHMMSGMFATAKTLARAAGGDPADGGDPLRVRLFKRMYRTDFSAAELAVIAEHLRRQVVS